MKDRFVNEPKGILTLMALLVFSLPALGADLDIGAREAVGLFQMACIANAGDGEAQRSWMDAHHVPHLNSQGAAIFLKNDSGVGYDASNTSGRFALTVLDNGVCTVFAEHAKDGDVISALETSKAGVSRQNDHPDTTDPRLHHYDYILTHGGIDYTVIVSTDTVPGHIQAMLSIARRVPNATSMPSPQN